MKKVILMLAIAFLTTTSTVSANTVNVPENYKGVYSVWPSNHPVYDDPNALDRKIIGYISNADWDKAMAEQAARSGQKLPIVRGGEDVIDEAGVVYKNACSQAGLSRHVCVNLAGTEKYRNDMITMARELIAQGREAQFPRFAGWFNLAR